MNDHQFKLQLQQIFSKAKISLQAAGFYEVDTSHRKHLIKLVAAGMPALKAVALIRQSAAVVAKYPDELQEQVFESIIEILIRSIS